MSVVTHHLVGFMPHTNRSQRQFILFEGHHATVVLGKVDVRVSFFCMDAIANKTRTPAVHF